MRSYKYLLILLLLVLSAIFITQFYWIKRAVKLQQYEINISLMDDFKEIIQFLEDNYYCFKSYTTVPIEENGYFYALFPSATGIDTAAFKTGRAGTIESDKQPKRLRFPYAATAQIEFSFEFNAPPPASSGKALTEVEMRMNEEFARYLKIGNFHAIDTVYLLEKLVYLNDILPKGIKAGIEILNPERDTIIYKTMHKNIKESFSKNLFILNEGSAFLPEVPLNFVLYDFRPFYTSINMWFLGVSVLLFSVLIFILLLFVRSINQQKRMVDLRNDLLANVTHEFNTPVTNISLALQSFKLTDSRNTQIAEIIKEENDRIKQNIGLMLNTASMRNGILDLDASSISLHSIIKIVADSVNLNLLDQNGTLNLELNAENDIIMGDEVHLNNLFHNLIDNALKYTEQNPVVKISTYNTKQQIIIVVKDNGIGISPEHQKLIFEKFYRISDKMRHEVKGFGLGLHYVNMIIEAHKAKISLDSALGQGAAFILKFALK